MGQPALHSLQIAGFFFIGSANNKSNKILMHPCITNYHPYYKKPVFCAI